MIGGDFNKYFGDIPAQAVQAPIQHNIPTQQQGTFNFKEMKLNPKEEELLNQIFINDDKYLLSDTQRNRMSKYSYLYTVLQL